MCYFIGEPSLTERIDIGAPLNCYMIQKHDRRSDYIQDETIRYYEASKQQMPSRIVTPVLTLLSVAASPPSSSNGDFFKAGDSRDSSRCEVS